MKAKTSPVMNRQILDEASTWFVDFRIGDVDAASRARFDEWLRQSPEHIRAYIEISKTYVDLLALKANQPIQIEALTNAARSASNVVSIDPIASDPRQRPDTSSPAIHPVLRSRMYWISRRTLAASIVLVCAAGALAWAWLHRYPSYATEIGENRSITLSDGSTIDLNARSSIRIEFSKDERDVELLEGQALFEVAKDATRPFIVHSGAAVVRAVGTQFDVNRAPSSTTVTVVEGRVAVLNENASGSAAAPSGSANTTPMSSAETILSGAGATTERGTFVSAGEQVVVTPAQITKPQQTDVAAATAWTQHRLIFDATPLSEVVGEFNRYHTRPIIIETDSLKDFHVSGVYASTDPTSLIRFLKEQPGIMVIESADAVRIRRP